MKSGRSNYPSLFRLLYFPLSVLWMECVVKLWCLGTLFNRGLWYTLLFTLPLGAACALLSSMWGETGNRRAAFLLTGILTAWFAIQTVYHGVFKTFLVLDTLTMAGDALGNYWRETLIGIWKALPALLLLLLPMAALIVLRLYGGRRGRRERSFPTLYQAMGHRFNAVLLCAMVVLQLTALLAVACSDDGIHSPSAIYHEPLEPELAVSNFGLLTTLRLDAGQCLFGAPASTETPICPEVPAPMPTAPESPTPSAYAPNVLNLDFDALMAGETDQTLLGMHQFFSNREPTMQNEYTGLFAGKNLLFFTAEGFWRYAVNETYTPTLYKLANEGFVFENFYNPLWWKSTTDGEYVACTSLIPTGARRSFKASGENAMPFCMGNMLRVQGYPTTAYHNHTWTYYNRDISHPNMGYDYYGVGHGLEVTPTWPESDLEMMEKTIPQALSGPLPFHNYYMTVSGHMYYTFAGNAMAAKHKNDVAGLDMSEEARAYIACNMELDQALAYTLDALEQAGELENTVICISGDHYPYGMDSATWDEFAGGHMDTDFEIYHSSLILWSGDMQEPIVIDKPCSSLDILPTLLNLFGLEYDSRLLAGRDILSDAPGLVMLSNKSFITELGRYNSKTDSFTPHAGVTVPDGYAAATFRQVKDLFAYSVKILDQNYYQKLGF